MFSTFCYTVENLLQIKLMLLVYFKVRCSACVSQNMETPVTNTQSWLSL